MPASGKTYFTDYVLQLLKQYKVAHIFGDAIAHISDGCNYSEDELNLKYENVRCIIKNVRKKNYDYLIIDDIFKRRFDYERMISELEEYYVIGLDGDLTKLIERNNKRPQYHRLSEEKMINYYNDYSGILRNDEIDLKVNTTQQSKYHCKKEICKFIMGVIYSECKDL